MTQLLSRLQLNSGLFQHLCAISGLLRSWL